jgi:zinc/manganese transport system permease protein
MMIEIFLPPVLLVIVLVMIHAWFGKGILQRGIIFTDLAIAQFAALGSAISLGYFHSDYIYFFTLAFALLSAFLISVATRRNIHLEAFIGILYVFGASGIMMVLADSAEGMEHFKALLASDILFTPLEDVFYSSVIYAGLGILIWKVYPRLQGFIKELLFFSMLAVTVTSSVQLAGVLVVFVLLVAPALMASMQKRFDATFFSFIYGWGFSLSAIVVSYFLDLPTGYSIVFIGSLTTAVAILFMSRSKESEKSGAKAGE